MNKIEKEIREYLLKNKNDKNKLFVAKLIPTIDMDTILGIKTPELRKYAKEIYKNKNWEDYIKILKHKYFDENNLHAFIIENINDYDRSVKEINRFLPYIDNWATCDSMSPKIFKKHLDELIKQIKIWIKSKEAYTIRFGVEMLMTHYLDKEFKPEYLDLVANIKYKSKNKYKKICIEECQDKYYVEMMISWVLATSMAKQYKYALPYIKNKKLETFTHNMVIRKSKESFRVTEAHKKELSKYKIDI